MANQQQIQMFLNKIIPMAMEDMKKTGILASLTIAQSCIESSFGLSGLTVSANNLYGIKGSYNGQSYNCMGFEEVNGKRVNQMITWKKYPSWQESVNDHSALFLKYDRYKNLRGCTDYKQACINVKVDGYCTSSTYSQLLIEIIESHQLYKYDQQVLSGNILSPTPQPTSNISTKKITISSANWNIRSQPSLTASIIKQINGGQYTSSKSIYGWYYIDSLNGYIVDKSVTKVEDVLSTFSISFTDVSTQSEINGIVDRVAQIGYKNHNITTQPTGSLTVTFTDISSQGEVDNLANIIGNFGYKNHVIRNS